jgi:hypothetical protein
MRPFSPFRFGNPAALAGGGASNSAEAQQFFDRLLTPPTAAREALYNALIDGLVADGVWAKLDALYIFAAADEGTALENLIQTTYQAARWQSSGAATFTIDQGFNAGSGLRQVTSNFNPSTATAPKFTQNDGMVFFWSYTTAQISQPAVLIQAILGAGLDTVSIYPKWSGGQIYARCNGATDLTGTNSGDSSGLYLVQRTASNAQALYRNSTLMVSNSAASSAVSNGQIACRCEHSTRCFGIGSSLTAPQRAALEARLTTYIAAVTGGVP